MLYPKIIGFNKLNAFVKIKTKNKIFNFQYPTPSFQLCYWLLVVGCWLLDIECWLLDIDNALFYTFVMLGVHSLSNLGYRERKLI